MYVTQHRMKLTRTEFAQSFTKPKNITVDYIADKIKTKNENFLGIWVGKPGCGKSRGALKYCEVLSQQFNKRFTISNVVFSIEEFMQLINELKNRHKNGEDVRGTCILYDETGVSLDNRAWQEKAHKIINDAIEVFRVLGLIVMFTAPGRGRVDGKLRELIHAIFHPIKKSRTAITVKFMILKDSVVRDKEYKVNLRVESRGWRMKVTSVLVSKPNPTLDRQYDLEMMKFKYHVLERGLHTFKPAKHEQVVVQQKITARQKEILHLAQAGLLTHEIAHQLGIGEAGVLTHLRNLRGKGYVA